MTPEERLEFSERLKKVEEQHAKMLLDINEIKNNTAGLVEIFQGAQVGARIFVVIGRGVRHTLTFIGGVGLIWALVYAWKNGTPPPGIRLPQ